MIAPAPPIGVEGKAGGLGAENHVGDAEHGKDEIVAERMGADALGGEGCKAGVEFGQMPL